MGLRSFTQRLAEKRTRRKWRFLHPAVGLPKDAPEYLETENGSSVRVLPESEHVPLPALASAPNYYLLVSFALVLSLTLAASGVVFYFLPKEPEPPDWVGYLLLTVVFLLPLIGGLLASAKFDSQNRKRMIELVAARPSRLFDPAEGDFLLNVDPTETSESLSGYDRAFTRAVPGFLEFEMSRAQLRIAADDLRMYLRKDNLRRAPGVSLRCDFGDYEFALDVTIEGTRRDAKNLKLGILDRFSLKRRSRTFARHLQSRMGLPVEDIDLPPEEEAIPRVPLPFVFSSESEEARSQTRPIKWLSVAGFFSLEFLFLAWLVTSLNDIFSSSGSGSLLKWCQVVLFAVLAVGTLLLFVRELRSFSRGRWVFEEQKVTYEPLDGPKVEISWDEIERVRWEQKGIELVGKKDSIPLDAFFIGFPQFSRARQVIKRCLGSTFDLSLTPIRQGVLFPACGIVLFLSGTAFYVGIENWDGGPAGWYWMGLWLTVFLTSGAILVARTWRNHRRDRKFNPKWRERRSRSRGTSG